MDIAFMPVLFYSGWEALLNPYTKRPYSSKSVTANPWAKKINQNPA
jgi:hypothetical protein